MEHHGGHLGAAVACLGMCLAMMVPMMLPALVPMLLRYRRARAGNGRDVPARADAGGVGGGDRPDEWEEMRSGWCSAKNLEDATATATDGSAHH